MDKINDEERARFLHTTREFFGRCAWSHKAQEKSREECAAAASRISMANILLTALTFFLATLVALGVGSTELSLTNLSLWTAVVGAISFALSVYQQCFTPEKRELAHRQASKDLLQIRDEFILLIDAIMRSADSLETLIPRRQALIDRVHTVYRYAPDTTPSSYKKASAGLTQSEELTFSTVEIDQFLPESLRLTEKKVVNQ